MMKNTATRLGPLAGILLLLASGATPALAGETALSAQYRQHQASERRETARELVAWSQGRGSSDAARLASTLEKGLVELGFHRRAVVTAVVENAQTGARHSVALWFERQSDPWVLAPTGALAPQMVRLSESGAWKAVSIASRGSRYQVVGGRVVAAQQVASRATR